MHASNRLPVGILLLCALFQSAVQAAPRPHFHITDLGTLPGGSDVTPFALNNRGDVVGRARNANGNFRGFLFHDGRMSELPIPGLAGFLHYINDTGEIVAQAEINSHYKTFFIGADGVVVDLEAQTGWDIWPAGINESGVVAGDISHGFIPEAVTWSNGVVRFLGSLDPKSGSSAEDINNRGEVLSTFYMDSSPGPGVVTAIMRDGAISVLGMFQGWGFNDYGHVVGTSWGGGQAILYRDGVLRQLGTLPGDYYSLALKINNSEQIIGYSEDGSDHIRPFLYSDGVMYDLNDLLRPNSGWILRAAADINDHGQIVGDGLHDGQWRAFLLTPSNKPGLRPERP